MNIPIFCGLLTILIGTTSVQSYDFFDLSRYPEGGKLKPGVELYSVKKAGGAPEKYVRRVVHWWPRKGVDFVDIETGMIPREWTLKPGIFDDGQPPPLHLDWKTFEHDKLDMPVDVGDKYIRQIQGYLHPPKDGDYIFKIAADDMGVFFLSTNDSPDNIRLVCYSRASSPRNNFTRYDGQISVPVPLKKGRTYYYEVLQKDEGSSDNAMVVWETAGLEEEVIGGSAISTLEGVPGIVIERRASLLQDVNTGIRPRREPQSFKAHLIGFDGIGNAIGDPFAGEDFFEPSVILRMADGRKRVFRSKSFCQADREFILDIYLKEMKRIQGTLDKTVYGIKPQTLKEYPGGTPIGEPGSLLLQSDHFAVPSGSQASGPNDRWLNPEKPEIAARCRESVFTMFEHMHAYLEYGGHLMPYWDRPEQYKYEVHVGGTILNGHISKGGGAGGGYGAQGMGWLGANPGGFGHEYGHGMSIQWRVGNGEILAQSMMELTDNRCTSYDHNINVPWRNCVHAEYNACLFYRGIGYDPNWGLLAVTAMPASAEEPSIFQTLARLGQQRGMFKDGIRGMGDMVGDYSARLPELDTPNQEPVRKAYFAAARNYLEAIDPARGVYRIPWDEAPEPFGANIIRLVPEEGGKTIEVDFQGYHDPAVYSDWRACIVAVDHEGNARYSDLWNKGRMTMVRREGDRRYWLTVAATPSALLYPCDMTVYQGIYAPRYPWQVTLRGAVPGMPHRQRLDLDDVHAAYGTFLLSGLVPVIPNTEAGKQFLADTQSFVDELRQRLGQATLPEKLAYGRLIRPAAAAVAAMQGAPHPNGGGWVAASAEAALTAYVGPQAMVLDNAKVLDHAIIEDFAVIKDRAVISGNARINGQAVISADTRLTGYQRAWMPLQLTADTEAPELTTRRMENLDENGLWANYAMDQPEAVMLEDWYRQHDGASFREFFCSLMNGYLYGRPDFVTEGSNAGFAFDGKTQYAELNRHIADLSQITVDMVVKWQGNGKQTLLDFGSGEDNHFMLTTDGKDGKLAFVAIVDGKNVAGLTSSIALARDAWTRVRLEIDGRQIALWIDDKPVGEAASTFQPAHVFKAGVLQRNFIAAGFDGRDLFKGIFDNVVVYHKVHGEEFTNLPAPFCDAPRRPDKGFAIGVLRSMGATPFEQDDRKNRLAERLLQEWNSRGGRALTQLMELKFRVPEYLDAVEKAKAFEQWKKESTEQFQQEFDTREKALGLTDQITDLKQRIASLELKSIELRKQKAVDAPPSKPTRKIVELQEMIEPLEVQLADLQKIEADARAAVAAMSENKAAQEEITLLEEEIKPLAEMARSRLKELNDGANDDADMKAWIRAQQHIPYSKEDKRVVRAIGELRGNVRDALLYMMKEELTARDAEFRKWSELTERVEDLKREELYRLYDYLLKNTEHPGLLIQNRWDQGELAEVSKALNEAKQQLQNEQRNAEQNNGLSVEDNILLQKCKDQLNERETDLREARATYVDEKLREAGLIEKEQAVNNQLEEATKIVASTYHAEYHVLCSFIRQNFHGFYNGRISEYIDRYAQKVVGGVSLRDKLDQVEKIEELYLPENWKTSVDQWDWRTVWEKDGSIENLPLTRKWLKRVRGNAE